MPAHAEMVDAAAHFKFVAYPSAEGRNNLQSSSIGNNIIYLHMRKQNLWLKYCPRSG